MLRLLFLLGFSRSLRQNLGRLLMHLILMAPLTLIGLSYFAMQTEKFQRMWESMGAALLLVFWPLLMGAVAIVTLVLAALFLKLSLKYVLLLLLVAYGAIIWFELWRPLWQINLN